MLSDFWDRLPEWLQGLIGLGGYAGVFGLIALCCNTPGLSDSQQFANYISGSWINSACSYRVYLDDVNMEAEVTTPKEFSGKTITGKWSGNHTAKQIVLTLKDNSKKTYNIISMPDGTDVMFEGKFDTVLLSNCLVREPSDTEE